MKIKKLKNLIEDYKKSINPPYRKNDFFAIGVTFLVLVVALFTAFSIPNQFKGSYTKQQSAAGVTPPPGVWQDITPSGLNIDPTIPGVFNKNQGAMAITPDPNHPGTLYLGSDHQGIWKSTDYGNTWARSDVTFPTGCGNTGIGDGRAWSIAIDEQDNIFATNGYGCAQGLWKSTDGGVHFTQMLPNTAPTPDVYLIQIDPYLTGHMIYSPHSEHECPANCDSPVGQSFDHGTTWTYTNVVPNAGWQYDIFFLNNSSTWLAASNYTGLYRTTDSGSTWTQVSTIPSSGTSLVKQGGSLYLGTHSGIAKSTDNGLTWNIVEGGDPYGMNSIVYANSKFYTRRLGAGQGPIPGPMRESSDGSTWTDGSQTFNNGPFNMNLDASYAYSAMEDGGLWRLPLSSGGSTPTSTAPSPTPIATPTPAPQNTWTNVTGNMANMPSECGNLTMLSNVPNSNSVIAGVAQKGYWANASGTSWSQLPGSSSIIHRPSWITYDPNNSSIFWTSGIYNNGGVYKTTDGGNTFQKLGNITHNDFVSVDFSDPNRQTILAGSHEQSQTIYKSTDGGNTWTNIGSTLPAGTGFSADPLILSSQTYIVNADTSWGGGTPGVYRTTNGGTTWTKVSSLDPTGAPLLASNGNIYWASGASLIKSTDNGVTWTQVGSGLQNIHPIQLQDGRIVTAGTSTLVISSDGGSTWNQLGANFPFVPESLVYSTNRGAFFISHWDCGGVVLSDAVAQMNYNFGFGVSPTSTPVPPTATPIPPTPTRTPTPTTGSGLIGDISGDGKVDLLDFSIMLSAWGTNNAASDLSHDGIVSLQDLSILLSHWGP